MLIAADEHFAPEEESKADSLARNSVITAATTAGGLGGGEGREDSRFGDEGDWREMDLQKFLGATEGLGMGKGGEDLANVLQWLGLQCVAVCCSVLK